MVLVHGANPHQYASRLHQKRYYQPITCRSIQDQKNNMRYGKLTPLHCDWVSSVQHSSLCEVEAFVVNTRKAVERGNGVWNRDRKWMLKQGLSQIWLPEYLTSSYKKLDFRCETPWICNYLASLNEHRRQRKQWWSEYGRKVVTQEFQLWGTLHWRIGQTTGTR